MWWQRPRWHGGPDVPSEIADTNRYRRQAEEESAQWPVFWLRGLPPKAWYDDLLAGHTAPEDSWESCSWGCMLDTEAEPFELPPGACVAVDASGGLSLLTPDFVVSRSAWWW